MFLGKSESTTQVTQLFKPYKSKEKIFRKKNNVQTNRTHYRTNNQENYSSKVEQVEPLSTSLIPKQFEALIKQLSEAALVINENFQIEHVYGDVTPYITIPGGKPNWNLVDIIHDVHKQEIRALVFKALRTKELAVGQPLDFVLRFYETQYWAT